MHITPEKLKQIRQSLALSQSALAKELDTTTQAVKHWEAGRRECSGPAAVLINLLYRLAGDAMSAAGTHRPKYKDLKAADWAAVEDYDWVELKKDGYFGELVGNENGWVLLSRSGHEVQSGPESLPDCRLLVEQIVGTEWATDRAPDGMYGSLVVWSALGRAGQHLSGDVIADLVDQVGKAGLKVTQSQRYSIDEAQDIWEHEVEQDKWEGLVFRTHNGQFARMKRRESMDYVCIEMNGDSAIGGLYNKRGKLVECVSVPRADDLEPGDVFEASGLAVTRRGSLRNPRWERRRPDKPALECVR
jgi:transcriptional regulator with XRE-family HTH domain